MKFQRGFTVTELAISIGIFIILVSVITLNLNSSQHKATIASTVGILLSDLGQQQIKAMVGDTEGRGTHDTYGIHFDSTSYTLFHGTYSANETTNFTVNAVSTQQISTAFPNAEVIFDKGNGEITCFNDLSCDDESNTITVSDTATGEQKTIEINKYGVVTGVN